MMKGIIPKPAGWSDAEVWFTWGKTTEPSDAWVWENSNAFLNAHHILAGRFSRGHLREYSQGHLKDERCFFEELDKVLDPEQA